MINETQIYEKKIKATSSNSEKATSADTKRRKMKKKNMSGKLLGKELLGLNCGSSYAKALQDSWTPTKDHYTIKGDIRD